MTFDINQHLSDEQLEEHFSAILAKLHAPIVTMAASYCLDPVSGALVKQIYTENNGGALQIKRDGEFVISKIDEVS